MEITRNYNGILGTYASMQHPIIINRINNLKDETRNVQDNSYKVGKIKETYRPRNEEQRGSNTYSPRNKSKRNSSEDDIGRYIDTLA